MHSTADYLTFGQWRYLRSIGQLQSLSASADPEVLTLEPRLHKLLNFFLDHKDLVLSREDLLTAVWGQGSGSDESLTRAIAGLRRALQDSRVEPVYIATLSKKGYCWLAAVAPVALPPESDTEPAPAAPLDLIGTQQAIDKWHDKKLTKLKRIRYIWGSTLVLILFSFVFAVLLSKMNEKATLPRYLQLTPVSALDGKEQTPLLSADQSLLVFQHQPAGSAHWHWVVQQLASMQIRQDQQQFQLLSQPHWLGTEHIVFRAQQQQKCAFWRKTVQQQFEAATPLFSCHQFIASGQAMTPQGLYWLDLDPATGQSQLWLWQQDSSQRLLMTFPAHWRGVSHLIVKNKKAYAIAQSGYSYSALLELDLAESDWRTITEFDFSANQLAWWGDNELLVNKSARQLQVLSLRTGTSRVFGEMTFNLADSSVWQQSLLAAYPAQAVTDLRRLEWQEQNNQIITLPFAESNRSEYLLLAHQDQYFFVSERSGLPQLWRSQGQVTEQISQFETQHAIGQLLWFEGKLLLLIDRQLYHFSAGQLAPFMQKKLNSESLVVCADTLYWVTRKQQSWALQQLRQGKVSEVLKDVVNVQCGPDHSLLLQQQDSAYVKQWRQGQISTLPVQINWRTTESRAWVSTTTGLYWLSGYGTALNYYDWKIQQQQQWPLAQPAQALMSDNGTVFVQQFRAQDTDIVWLHPEPVE
ncbi:winged helix-turn-helix domain-containing protein [Rheinheimera soli]|uniref:DNA-binding winged helix-turn-helix (WHTH) protein n=1 Tax=Rheinheimera soli TaxID=443616 RepID=A0ABU1VXQ3_9GAMM|nr:winged helix-turn-helix domain-containing protein [Rheinheimera soli]MDR7120493.1 DNA-binding winged helix-turn-helix (wHTH) protein [Rheinheimera soli]